MFKTIHFSLILTVMALVVIGCSGGGASPTVPVDDPASAAPERESESQRVLWGIWNISFEPDEMVVSIDPIRNAQAHFNVTNMVTPPQCYDCLEINVNSFDPVTRILDVDVTLRNKYILTGYDVRGILYTNDIGHELRNADDWTGL